MHKNKKMDKLPFHIVALIIHYAGMTSLEVRWTKAALCIAIPSIARGFAACPLPMGVWKTEMKGMCADLDMLTGIKLRVYSPTVHPPMAEVFEDRVGFSRHRDVVILRAVWQFSYSDALYRRTYTQLLDRKIRDFDMFYTFRGKRLRAVGCFGGGFYEFPRRVRLYGARARRACERFIFNHLLKLRQNATKRMKLK